MKMKTNVVLLVCIFVASAVHADELTIELLPPCVTSPDAPMGGTKPIGNIDTLTREVVMQGLSETGPDSEDAHGMIVDRVEKELISQVMAACNNVQTKAATKLGINRNTLHKKMKEYGLDS